MSIYDNDLLTKLVIKEEELRAEIYYLRNDDNIPDSYDYWQDLALLQEQLSINLDKQKDIIYEMYNLEKFHNEN